MRKVVFTIDDIEYFKRKFKLSDEQVAEFFGEKESFKVIYTITGNGRNPDKYELTDHDGNKITLDSLNGVLKFFAKIRQILQCLFQYLPQRYT